MNRLANEKSPYLLQHAENPVDWYPWGEEAFEKAKKEEKPIFLSIGYATCHWCHVMAHESFEGEAVAGLLNTFFVSIKVDREERPDIDHVYMSVCQAMTGSGGWPLSIFMTPEAKPFFAGTYFPKTGRMGRPGFVDLLGNIVRVWEQERNKILSSSEQITEHIRFQPIEETSAAVPGSDVLKKGFEQLSARFDSEHGGFGTAPKFPTPHQLTFLLRWYKRNADPAALAMVEKTLISMRAGGIFDHIGYGFHRYAVDAHWLVPHFEKMLYDQALLAMAYTEAFQATGNQVFADTAREIFTYVLRDMTASAGGFYSAEDADSEGREGKFYVWTPDEVISLLGKEPGETVCRYFDITAEGNFEDRLSIAHTPVQMNDFLKQEGISIAALKKAIHDARKRLFEHRNHRIPPLKDDKILTAWNGLMIAALAKGYCAFGDHAYVEVAAKAVEFILKNLQSDTNRLLRRYRKGEAAYNGYLDDYAFLVWGLIELYEATFEVVWLEEAVRLNDAMIEIFWDQQGGGLFFTGVGNESLITRTKDAYDGALPSGNSVAALNFLRLGRMTGNVELERKAEALMTSFVRQVDVHPSAYTQFLVALDYLIGPGKEIVIVGDMTTPSTQEMIRTIRGKYIPNKVLLVKSTGQAGQRLSVVAHFVKPMSVVEGKPTVYICENFACTAPATSMADLEKRLQ